MGRQKKKPTLGFIDLLYYFFRFYIVYFLMVIISVLLGLVCLCCSASVSFRCAVRFCIWDFSCFLRQAWIAMYFPFRSASTASQSIWIVVFSFSFVSIYFLISSLIAGLTHSFFSRVFFNLHFLEVFLTFSYG